MKAHIDSLQLALKNEMKKREFYLKNAERTKNHVGKAMFLQIAEEEFEHYERLKQLCESWEKQSKWPETVPLTVKDTVIKNVLLEAAKQAPSKIVGDADDLKAIQVAIEFEAKGAEFYARLRDLVSELKEKAFFNLLANIEHEHYVSLKDTDEYLKDLV